MEKVREMDWMAPEALRKARDGKKKKVKAEEQDKKSKSIAKEEAIEDDSSTEGTPGVNLANAVDLSDSEEEEEMEDIMDDFAISLDAETGESSLQERLYFFQFPDPLPEFIAKASSNAKGKGVDRSGSAQDGTKTVTFADGTKPAAPGTEGDQVAVEKLDGVIGQLEVYQSGAVKMRLSNGILLDVNAATQTSFLQHAVYLNPEDKKLCVLGQVNRRFVVSPDIDTLLAAMEQPGQPADPEIEGLIKMDNA
ncbi:hypothetical protein PHLGIDRAFT_85772 [Phlebiopsis gigantea 11061_1 CR5-6]|uniref:Uncharacterized protein n=1 Tax=Phlebiopsis gigantea (strain 11061_1 CR5-6) TaxID=745531 RepID=A0A0C3SBH7_PHLG1|nr:hypothetical protein PHLGIDRAFT_85772 [Phlebiopsis gigantea 11061_1 CR5-6]